MTDPAIVTAALTKRYGSDRGVEELDFEVKAGEVFGYLGPNGAGKSTTIRTLLDLIRPTSGSANVLGLDSHRKAREIHARTGYLPGDLSLYPQLTGRELLTYYAHLRGGVDPAAIDGLADRLSCDLDRRVGALSHGNRQKLGLIQAFMHRPDLLILDEPTQGLDPLVQQEFHRMVNETRADGRTVFLSSHVLPEVERMCDRAGIIREGRLVAIEDIRDMKARSVRELEIHFDAPVQASEFAAIEGIAKVAADGNVLRCTMKGPLDPLIKECSRHTVLTLSATEPSLEEIFLEFYGETEV